MKTEITKEEQFKKYLKKQFMNGLHSVIWINFIATDFKGIKYLAGHNKSGVNYTLSSDGKLFTQIQYFSGTLILTDEIKYSNNRELQFNQISKINNNNSSVIDFVNNFEFDF